MIEKFNFWVGTGFTMGKILPKAPGTEGSFVALVVGSLMYFYVGWWTLPVLFLASLLAGILTAPWFLSEFGDDPGIFVMDEWAGQLLSMHILFFLPETTENLTIIYFLLGSFIGFRFFDILKPLGIKKAESLGHVTGVMIDDIIAGIYTFITLFLLILVSL
jgi:phosphatidylglycerophosphatase A